MNSDSLFRRFYFLWILLGAIILGAVLFVIFSLVLLSSRPKSEPAGSTTPVLTVIPAPTLTQVILVPTLPPQSIPTATLEISKGDIAQGVYVQISGTNGEGLRLRAAPGTQSKMLFLGMDDEVFLVKDGPRDANGFTWWFLQAPYDEKRSGWAAENYLTVIHPIP